MKEKRAWSFSDWCRGWSRPLFLPVARFLGRMGFTPNGVTLLGLAAYGATGLVVGLGHPRAAGVMLAILGPLDVVDGLLARDQGDVTRFGGFLDSCMDRYAEFFLYLGLLFHLDGPFDPALVMTALAGSLLVSYNRARAEALAFSCKVGLLTRFERLFILAVGLIFGMVQAALFIIAVLAHATAVQRILHVYGQSGDGSGPRAGR